jgi:HEAT repeat protein
MKRWMGISLSVIAMAIATFAVAAEPDPIAQPAGALAGQLDDALKAVATFEYGKDSGPLELVERIVIDAAKDARLRDAVEQRLIRALGSPATTDAKTFLCRQLRTIGTAKCVPQLEELLTDPQLSHMARYALGTIDDPAAPAAMRRALHKTSSVVQVGIINTLADMRCRPALPDVVILLDSPDSAVAQASAGALGRIGGAEAVNALQKARPKASKALRQCIDGALLICAEQLLADGQPAQAAKIYQQFYSSGQPSHYRLAGLRGLVAAKGPEAAPLLTEAIKGPDAVLRSSAIAFMEKVSGPDATKTFVALLPSLAPDAQELVLRALGSRGDATAAQAVWAAAKSTDEPVRLAALEALGGVGDASTIPLLTQTAATAGDPEKKAARASLVRLRGPDIDAALIRSIDTGEPKVAVEAIVALADRGTAQAAGKLLKTAGSENDQDVRLAAIRALGTLADKADLAVLVALAVNPKNPEDRSAIEQALAAVFKRIKDKPSQAAPLLAALPAAPADAKPTLIRLLGRPATPEALQAVRAAAKDANADVVDAAIRTLADWPDAGPADDLLAVASASSNQLHKVLALRGYVRMAGLSGNPTAMYVRAMELADRPDDKKLVLGGLATADSPQALAIVETYLKDEQLQTEAALAAVQIADRLRQNDPTRARTTLENVVAAVKDAKARQKAQEIINEMDQYEGYILVWLAAGPYSEKGKQGSDIFDMAFPPEKSDAQVEWKRITQGIGSWDINLESTFGDKDHVGAYMKTRVWSPADQDVRLELGSDDAIKVWLNGKVIHANNANRGMSPRQDLVNARLNKGWNDLLLKVTDNSGGWAFCCRIRKPDGSALDGLKIEAN